jgi:hypothetical protein
MGIFAEAPVQQESETSTVLSIVAMMALLLASCGKTAATTNSRVRKAFESEGLCETPCLSFDPHHFFRRQPVRRLHVVFKLAGIACIPRRVRA